MIYIYIYDTIYIYIIPPYKKKKTTSRKKKKAIGGHEPENWSQAPSPGASEVPTYLASNRNVNLPGQPTRPCVKGGCKLSKVR